MNMDNIAGTAAAGVLVFLGVVVAPHAPAWGAAATVLATLAAIGVAGAGVLLAGLGLPPERSARHLESEAAWDHALAELLEDAA